MEITVTGHYDDAGEGIADVLIDSFGVFIQSESEWPLISEVQTCTQK